MTIKPLLLAFVLALGMAGCVIEDDEPIPTDPLSDDGDAPPRDPPGDTLPAPGDNTCGGELKGDGACTPRP